MRTVSSAMREYRRAHKPIGAAGGKRGACGVVAPGKRVERSVLTGCLNY